MFGKEKKRKSIFSFVCCKLFCDGCVQSAVALRCCVADKWHSVCEKKDVS